MSETRLPDPPKPDTPTPPSGVTSTVNAGHVIATGSTTVLLAKLLMWLSHLPLQPLDFDTASSIAGLAVAAGGMIVTAGRVVWVYFKNRKQNK